MCACLYYLIRVKEEFFLCESGFLSNLEESESLLSLYHSVCVCITAGQCFSNCVTFIARSTKRDSKGNRKPALPAFALEIMHIFIFNGFGISFVYLT